MLIPDSGDRAELNRVCRYFVVTGLYLGHTSPKLVLNCHCPSQCCGHSCHTLWVLTCAACSPGPWDPEPLPPGKLLTLRVSLRAVLWPDSSCPSGPYCGRTPRVPPGHAVRGSSAQGGSLLEAVKRCGASGTLSPSPATGLSSALRRGPCQATGPNSIGSSVLSSSLRRSLEWYNT